MFKTWCYNLDRVKILAAGAPKIDYKYSSKKHHLVLNCVVNYKEEMPDLDLGKANWNACHTTEEYITSVHIKSMILLTF